MNHITELQVLELAEKLNYSAHPSVLELQALADRLDSTYAWVSHIWDTANLQAKITSKKAVREREKANEKKEKGPSKKGAHKCIDCGADLVTPWTKLCLECAYKRDLARERRRKAKQNAILQSTAKKG